MELILLMEDEIAKENLYSLIANKFVSHRGDWGDSVGDRLLVTECNAICCGETEEDTKLGFVAHTRILIQIAMTDKYIQNFREAMEIICLILNTFRGNAVLWELDQQEILLRVKNDLILDYSSFQREEYKETLEFYGEEFRFEDINAGFFL